MASSAWAENMNLRCTHTESDGNNDWVHMINFDKNEGQFAEITEYAEKFENTPSYHSSWSAIPIRWAPNNITIELKYTRYGVSWDNTMIINRSTLQYTKTQIGITDTGRRDSYPNAIGTCEVVEIKETKKLF